MTYLDIYADPALPVLEAAAAAVAYHYSEWISEPDLYQSAWEWRLRHITLVNSFLDKEKPDVSGLNRVVQSYLQSVARKEKALSCGYSVDDECYYVPAVIAELLPLVGDIEAALLPSAGSDEGGGSRGRNPHGQGDFVASLLDVREAWINTAFRGTEMQLIELRYINGLEWGEIAASLSMTVEDAKRYAAIGLRRMSERLGGLPARECPRECPDCKEKGESE